MGSWWSDGHIYRANRSENERQIKGDTVSDRTMWKTAIQKRGEKTFWDPTFEERQMEEKGRGRFWLKQFLLGRGVDCIAL